MDKMKVVITDYEYENVDLERRIIEEAGFSLFDYQAKTEEELIRVTKDADAVLVQYANITRRVLSEMERCKIVVRYGIGYNNIDCEAAAEYKIYAANVPDYGIDEVSGHAVTMILALSKKLLTLQKAMKNGDRSYASVVPLYRFEGSTVGLVGFGRIPQAVARKLSGFNVRILAFDPYLSPETAKKAGVLLVDFDTLLKESDFVSLHCPLSRETTGLLNKDAFSKMKKTAFLVNTSRGPVIEERALIEALKSGGIAGAGLDVFETEPLSPDSELLKMENVILTPHCAWYSEQAIKALQGKAAEEAVRVLQGSPPRNAVNRF